MPDMNKVIKGLECCTAELGIHQHQDDFCAVCPYKDKDPEMWYCFHKQDLMRDALVLLKAQEPRVMTLEEAKSACVVEYRSGKMCEVGSRLLDLNVDPLNAEYGKIYRIWTSRPDERTREETPWHST